MLFERRRGTSSIRFIVLLEPYVQVQSVDEAENLLTVSHPPHTPKKF